MNNTFLISFTPYVTGIQLKTRVNYYTLTLKQTKGDNVTKYTTLTFINIYYPCYAFFALNIKTNIFLLFSI